MKLLVNSKEMKKADDNTVSHFYMDAMVLMERAAVFTVECIEKHFKELQNKSPRVLVLAGSGGNGGDGVAVARILHLRGVRATVFLLSEEEKWCDTMARQVRIAREYGVEFVKEFPEKNYDLYVDAIFGNGLNKEITGKYKEVITLCNEKQGVKISVDIPSGISADTGKVLGVAFRADETVTFGFYKRGLVFYEGAAYAGKVSLGEIGITRESFLGEEPETFLLEKEDLRHALKRNPAGNKGTFGKVLVIAGSYGMAGASMFSAGAALRMGCGMVKIFTQDSNREIIQRTLPEAMLTLYSQEDFKENLHDKLSKDLNWADVCVIGPGLSLSEEAISIVKEVVCQMKEGKVSTYIWDADAITILSQHRELLEMIFEDEGRTHVFTPHMMEFSRLSGASMEKCKEDFMTSIDSFCKKKSSIFVCKDARTVVYYKDRQFVNQTGCDALATAGSGDCLTGVLAGFLATMQDRLKAVCFGVMLHGILGEEAAAKKGNASVIASDLVDIIPDVLQKNEIFETNIARDE